MSNNDSLANNSQEPDNYFSAIPLEERRKIWDRLCRTSDKPVRVPPLTDFDRTFQELVGPRLETLIACEACAVAFDLQSFSEAHACVIARARRYGATSLSEAALLGLDIWISQQLASVISEVAR